jgi:hypothetical protein
VRQAERADFSKLMICQIFSTDVKKAGGGSELYTRLEIISDVVSEKARSGKIPIPHRLFPIPHRFFPIPHRYFRWNFFRYVPFRYHIGNYF